MCQSIKTISKGKNGELSLCVNCKIYHLEFNNLYFEFDYRQYIQFKEYLKTIDAQFWEYKYAKSTFKRKIPIPSVQPNLVLMFNRQEIEELKDLFFRRKGKSLLNVDDIDYQFVLN